MAVAPRLEAYFLRIGDLLLLASAVVLAWSWGTFVRARRTFIAAEQQRAVERERTRIARELHDIVSHGLSATVLLAEGAAAQVHTDPDRAEQAMLRVRDTGRNSLGEMRRMLAVLRDDEPAPDLPQPGVADLERLVEDARGTGLPVVLASTARDLPAGLDVTVYRLVQEALTNVRKHAGEGVSRVDVVVEDRGPETVVRVSDDGAGPVGSGSSGRGLVGMRERVQAYAGTLRAGSRATGGFEVEAVLRREAKR